MDDENGNENDIFEDSNKRNLSNFGSYLNDKPNDKMNSNSSSHEKLVLEAIKIKLNDKINEIENNSLVNNDDNHFDFNDFSSIEKNSKEESFDMSLDIKNIKKEFNLINGIEKLNGLIEKFDEKYIDITDTPIVKCLVGEKDKNNNIIDCKCIPLITIKRYCICFNCKNHSEKKYMEMNTYNILKNIHKLFVKGPRENDETKKINSINEGYKDNMMTFHIKKIVDLYIEQKVKFLKGKIEKFKCFKNDYNNKNNVDQTFQVQILKRIKQIFFPFIEKLNLFFYFIIIKRLVFEYEDSYYYAEDSQNKINLLKNLSYSLDIFDKDKEKSFEKIMEKTHNKNKNKNKTNKILKFDYIIQFYFDEEIKSEVDKNIFIAINNFAHILIFSINFIKNTKLEGEKINPYELIKIEKINDIEPNKIAKFKRLFQSKQNENYFILNSRNSTEYGKALIINVTENNYENIKEKYKVEIIQTIKDTNGLFSSIEFFYKEKTYLLNYNKKFELWEHNPEKNIIEKDFIENEIIDNNISSYFGPLMYAENKKLFIIQCFSFSSKSTIEFYKFNDDNNKFSFEKIDKIIEFFK